jgi:hypothetical protein
VENDKASDESFHFCAALQVPGGLALSDSEKEQALGDRLEVQIQPVDDPSDPAVTETVNEAVIRVCARK